MKRFGLIIANPGEEGRENYCEGVNKDVRNYENFLCSPVGGAWNKSEIHILQKPSSLEVLSAITQAKQADYAFIVFAGHGHYSADKRSTMLNLRPSVDIDSAVLRDGAKKQTVILDCCRKIERPMLVEKRAALAFADSAASRMSTVNCRKYFDREVERCPNSLVLVHSCSIDQTAADDSGKGGLYSYNLIDSTNDWASSLSINSSLYFSRSIVKTHEIAAAQVSRLSSNRQEPEIEKPRSEPYFPFGIVAW